jgi:HK97 family phage portal protein
MGLLDKLFSKQEQKSYSSPELLLAYYGKTPRFNEWDAEKAVKEGFKHSTWVYSCINLRASSAGQVPFLVERKVGDEWVLDTTSELSKLIEKPNPDMDWMTMIQFVVQHLDLSGNGYWSKVRAGNRIAELWPLLPNAIKVVPGRERLVDKYEYDLGVVRRNIDPKDLIHFKYPDPSNFYFGLSPLHSAAQAVDIDNESERFQKVSLENRGLSDVHFEVPPEATAEQVQQLKKIYQDQQAGPRNARRALFSSAKATILNTSAAELDFVESRRFIRDEICSAFGVPPPMVGSYERATLANIETARKIFWRDTMLPILDKITGYLNNQLVPEFGAEYRIRYDLSDVDALQEDYSDKIRNAKELWSMGIPLNAINQKLELGFDNVEGGDVGYLPSGIIPSTFEEAPEVDAKTLNTLAYGK